MTLACLILFLAVVSLWFFANEYSALCVKNFINYMEKSNPFKSAQQECDVVLK